MVLKKQTVWLLTMLSLIVVLSVYYLTAPGQSPGQLASTEEKQGQEKKDSPKNISTDISASEQFAEYRLDKQNARKDAADDYNTVISSSKSSSEEVSAAVDGLEALKTLGSSEKQLEDAVLSKGFKDCVVVTEGNQVNIHVASKSLSNKQAQKIIASAHKYLGSDKLVKVSYVPEK